MNALVTSKFRAERQSNGEVWISSRVFSLGPIIIPQDRCKELAEFIWPNVESDEEEWIGNYNPSPYKVDYNHWADEPE